LLADIQDRPELGLQRVPCPVGVPSGVEQVRVHRERDRRVAVPQLAGDEDDIQPLGDPQAGGGVPEVVEAKALDADLLQRRNQPVRGGGPDAKVWPCPNFRKSFRNVLMRRVVQWPREQKTVRLEGFFERARSDPFPVLLVPH
jgi:hypothetical protein